MRSTFYLYLLTLLTYIGSSHASERLNQTLGLQQRCTLVYSATASTSPVIQRQYDLLSSQLPAGVAIFDLNRWDSSKAGALSGRQRKLLRKHYKLPKHSSTAVVIDRSGQVKFRQDTHIELTQLLDVCRR